MFDFIFCTTQKRNVVNDLLKKGMLKNKEVGILLCCDYLDEHFASDLHKVDLNIVAS
jgi:hypothetical protein